MTSPQTDIKSSLTAGSTPVPSQASINASEKDIESIKHTVDAVEEPSNIRPADCAFGWIPTLAVMVNYMFIFGASNSYGVFSTYYLNEKFAGTSASTLS
ncbi:hypothetical protein IWW51_006850, partial [Coemansia sp. RSA 2702]